MIPAVHAEVRSLIIQRNRIAKYLTEDKLAPVIDDVSKCRRCENIDACVVHHKACENGTEETSGMGELFTQKTGHLQAAHLEFFEFWNRLISLELSDVNNLRKQIWTTLPEEREKTGKCLSKMVIAQESHTGGHAYTFKRQQPESLRSGQTFPSLQTTSSFLESHIHAGDPVVVSAEDGHFVLAIGFVRDLAATSITLDLDREFHPPHPLKVHQQAGDDHDFLGIMELQPADPGAPLARLAGAKVVHPSRPKGEPIIYRIDLDELSSGFGLARTNLLKLFAADGEEKLRRLIVDLEPPTFKPASHFNSVRGHLHNFNSLNVDQKRAVERVIRASDYGLILGMPGTGKTTTIAYIVRALVTLQKTVLLASYTHSAVDNILLKLRELDPSIGLVRLGNSDKVHPGVREFCPNPADLRSVKEIEDMFEMRPVVATTCLGIGQFDSLPPFFLVSLRSSFFSSFF